MQHTSPKLKIAILQSHNHNAPHGIKIYSEKIKSKVKCQKTYAHILKYRVEEVDDCGYLRNTTR